MRPSFFVSPRLPIRGTICEVDATYSALALGPSPAAHIGAGS